MALVTLGQMVQMFIMMAIGWLLFKRKIFNGDMNRRLTTLLLDVTLPLMILHSVFDQTGARETGRVMYAFAVAALLFAVLPLLSVAIVKLLRMPKGTQGMYAFMMTFANVGFMGMPLVNSLYGSEGMLYMAVFNIVFNIFVFTVGVWLVFYDREDRFTISAKRMLSPTLIGCVIAVVVYFTGIQLPAPVDSAMGAVGATTTPLAMMIIGSTLASMRISDVFGGWRSYVFCVIKQFALPLAGWYVLGAFISDELIRDIAFFMLALPAANVAVMFATEYQVNESMSAKNVFLTTITALVSLPLLALICF